MPVKPDSRFAGLPVIQTTAPDGSARQVIGLRLRRPEIGETVRYQVKQGETIDLIAHRFYGDAGLWWRIFDANPAIYPLDLVPGQILDIPAPGPATQVTRARRF